MGGSVKPQCKTCKFFKPSLDYEAFMRTGRKVVLNTGFCEPLDVLMQQQNAWMWRREILLLESFGCVMHQPRVEEADIEKLP